jgi:hypothetical protein
MGKVLLVGNGINQLYSGRDWGQLMMELAKGADCNVENFATPYPIFFEQILRKTYETMDSVESRAFSAS